MPISTVRATLCLFQSEITADMARAEKIRMQHKLLHQQQLQGQRQQQQQVSHIGNADSLPPTDTSITQPQQQRRIVPPAIIPVSISDTISSVKITPSSSSALSIAPWMPSWFTTHRNWMKPYNVRRFFCLLIVCHIIGDIVSTRYLSSWTALCDASSFSQAFQQTAMTSQLLILFPIQVWLVIVLCKLRGHAQGIISYHNTNVQPSFLFLKMDGW
jgi:hypothetical protein